VKEEGVVGLQYKAFPVGTVVLRRFSVDNSQSTTPRLAQQPMTKLYCIPEKTNMYVIIQGSCMPLPQQEYPPRPLRDKFLAMPTCELNS